VFRDALLTSNRWCGLGRVCRHRNEATLGRGGVPRTTPVQRLTVPGRHAQVRRVNLLAAAGHDRVRAVISDVRRWAGTVTRVSSVGSTRMALHSKLQLVYVADDEHVPLIWQSR
jgi:hypothetical protein